MKRLVIIIMLVLTSIRESYSQQNQNNNNGQTKSDQIFQPDATLLNHHFTINLTKGNKVLIDLPSIKSLNYIKNIDSIFLQALKDLQPLKDSLETETNSVRVDYVIDTTGNKKVRIIDHTATGNAYSIKGNNISSLKIEQDTLVITGQLREFKSRYQDYDRVNKQLYYQLTFIVNNLSEIHIYLNGTLNKTINDIASDPLAQKEMQSKKESKYLLNTTYYPYENKEPVSANTRRHIIEAPYLQATAQTFGNTFAPSISFGFSYVRKKNTRVEYFTYMMEMVFFFQRNESKLQQFRNEFTTIQYLKTSSNNTNSWLFNAYSLGYLRNDRRRGEYLEKNTFKLGLPGLKYKNLILQPHFIFNDFLKNVSPGFKIGISY